MEQEKLGVSETKDVVVLLAKVGVSVVRCVQAKKFLLTEFVNDFPYVLPALSGIQKVSLEVKDLDSDEGKLLLEAVVVELAPLGVTTSDAAKHFVNAGISFVQGVIETVKAVEALKHKDNAAPVAEVVESPVVDSAPQSPVV